MHLFWKTSVGSPERTVDFKRMHPEVIIIIVFVITNTFEHVLYARRCAKCLLDLFKCHNNKMGKASLFKFCRWRN